MRIVFFLYDGFTVLDAVGPFETLARIPGADVQFVAKQAGMVANDNGLIDIYAPLGIDEIESADILVIPGGFADEAVRNDPHQMDWVRKIAATTKVNASICTGSLIFAAAGLLEGRKATTHWARYDVLRSYGAIPVEARWVDHGDIITAAGVSAASHRPAHQRRLCQGTPARHRVCTGAAFPIRQGKHRGAACYGACRQRDGR